ncbi:SHOCT domain-containing protein [Streptomyces dubilierae]|uniref:SHOCT domain-containing protein n=1 Tax=Streptomyces dubilierae TaxID=3075533 RepID=A0ABU2P658_9ACTN|nr:SHOCT domain-containing protein [Streptomyces sp. DSM 41921]MDT0386265.1 SHOCT domain-containing protein [Streptomyces sp. DSM 41921]
MPGLLRGIARTAVISGTATAVSNRVSRRQAGRWAEQDSARALAYQQPAARPAAPSQSAAASQSADAMTTRIDQLRQLADLKAQGVLTEEEFAAQKSRLLG